MPAMSDTLDQKIFTALKGNVHAVECFFLLRDILHFWDDLIDKDHAVPPEGVHSAMFKALVELPSNPFYQRFGDQLRPVLVNAIANWRAANQFETSGDNRRLQLAYVIRSDYANILIQMAYLVGGRDWVMEVTPSIRDVWTSEDFNDYLVNLGKEQFARARGETNVL